MSVRRAVNLTDRSFILNGPPTAYRPQASTEIKPRSIAPMKTQVPVSGTRRYAIIAT